MITTLHTDDLVLRKPTIEDAPQIFENYASDPEATLYLTWSPHKSISSVEGFLQTVIDQIKSGETLLWLILLKGERKAIGMIGARLNGYKVDIGYVLSKRYWKKGYMTQAANCVAEWLLDQPDIYRVGAVCDIENIGSARVLEKAKFTKEGCLSRWMIHPNRSPEPRDCYIYSRSR